MPESAPSRPGNTPSAALAHLDGRHAWRERNRLAVVDALLDLYAEGNLRPGAQDVADRSGVSRRSVFRYFEDLDDLDRTAIERQHSRVGHLFDLPGLGDGPLANRIHRMADHRVALFTAIAPVARVVRARAPFHPVLADELAEGRRLLLRQVERQFAPELATLTPGRHAHTAAAVNALCSFEVYDLLTAIHGLQPAEVHATMVTALTALLDPQPLDPERAATDRTPAAHPGGEGVGG